MVQVDRGEHLRSGDWLEANRRHLERREADTVRLPAPTGDAPLPTGALDGLRVLDLQAGDGQRALELASRGAEVIGIDLSMPAVRRARARAEQERPAGRTRFVCANLYEARHMLPEPGSFDLVVSGLGALAWLPDLDEWARIVRWFLVPGGRVVLLPMEAGAGPDALVDDEEPALFHRTRPRSAIVDALAAAGLVLAPGDAVAPPSAPVIAVEVA